MQVKFHNVVLHFDKVMPLLSLLIYLQSILDNMPGPLYKLFINGRIFFKLDSNVHPTGQCAEPFLPLYQLCQGHWQGYESLQRQFQFKLSALFQPSKSSHYCNIQMYVTNVFFEIISYRINKQGKNVYIRTVYRIRATSASTKQNVRCTHLSSFIYIYLSVEIAISKSLRPLSNQK